MIHWTITRRALREYCELRGWDPDSGRAKPALLEELRGAHEVGEQDNGLVLYRGAPPARLRLLATAEDELVSVLAGHDGTRRAVAPATVQIALPKISRDQLDAWTAAAGGRSELSRWIIATCDRAARKR